MKHKLYIAISMVVMAALAFIITRVLQEPYPVGQPIYPSVAEDTPAQMENGTELMPVSSYDASSDTSASTASGTVTNTANSPSSTAPQGTTVAENTVAPAAPATPEKSGNNSTPQTTPSTPGATPPAATQTIPPVATQPEKTQPVAAPVEVPAKMEAGYITAPPATPAENQNTAKPAANTLTDTPPAKATDKPAEKTADQTPAQAPEKATEKTAEKGTEQVTGKPQISAPVPSVTPQAPVKPATEVQEKPASKPEEATQAAPSTPQPGTASSNAQSTTPAKPQAPAATTTPSNSASNSAATPEAATQKPGKTVLTTKSTLAPKAGEKTITTATLSMDGDVITLRLEASTLIRGKSFLLKSPDRAVVDLTGPWNVEAPRVPSNRMLQAIRIGKPGEATRLVFDMKVKPERISLKQISDQVLEIRVR